MSDEIKREFAGSPMLEGKNGNVIVMIDIAYAIIILHKAKKEISQKSILKLLDELMSESDYDEMRRVESEEFDTYYDLTNDYIINLFPSMLPGMNN